MTGFGALALAVVGFGAAAAGVDWTGPLWLAFAGVVLAGCTFESSWRATHSTNAIRPDRVVTRRGKTPREGNKASRNNSKQAAHPLSEEG